jgi:predicted Zn-dependent peptidase
MRPVHLTVLPLAALLFATATATAFAAGPGSPGPAVEDPAAVIRVEKLGDGVKAVFAPSDKAKTFQIRVRVDAGHFNELPGKSGTAHLLEHYLFTDAKLGPDKTYLETIREAGGSANAITSTKTTEYFATVPAKLADWIVDTFGHMLFDRGFDEGQVEHTQGPVFLEIGRPNVFDYVSAAFSSKIPSWARYPGFWESEFGIVEPQYDVSAARVDTGGLKAADLRWFYEKFYHPANLTVFVAGRFDFTAMRGRVIQHFAGLKPNPEGGGWKDPEPRARTGALYETTSTSATPSIEIGTKVSAISHADEMALRVYLEYLSHRLMKELRNKQGDTYTVWPDVTLRQGSGKATIHFQAPAERYDAILARVRSMIDQEARHGEFSEEMFEEASSLYLKKFELSDLDSGTMMHFAVRRDHVERNYPEDRRAATDLSAFAGLTRSSFLYSLRRSFEPGMELESLQRPPLFFRFDLTVILVLAFAAWMTLWRWILARPFRHDRVRWVRKISYPPAYLLQLVLLYAVTFLTAAFLVAMARIQLNYRWLGGRSLVESYLEWIVMLGAGVSFCQLAFASAGRKVMLVDSAAGAQLWIKSLGYWSRVIPLADIRDIRLVSPLGLTPWQLLGIRGNFHYFEPRFWRKGLLIRTRAGRLYYLSFRDPEKAKSELERALPSADAGSAGTTARAA